MTKHFSIEPNIIVSGYIRPDDDAIMVEVSPGCFVNRDYRCAQTNDDTPIEDEEIPWHAKARKRLTDFEALLYCLIQELPKAEAVEISRVRKKPRCNRAASTARFSSIEVFRQCDDKLFREMAAHAVGYRHSTPRALARILSSRLDSYGPCENTADARRNKIKIAKYNIDVPESANPEHTLFPREPRNSSPTREKDAGMLNALLKYCELNESARRLRLQSNFLQADNDNFTDPDWEEGDLKKPQRNTEAELETRPGLSLDDTDTELVACYDVPTVKYETRQVGLITGPKLTECGYCMFPTSPLVRTMTIPVSGDVWCIGYNKDKLLEHRASARAALPLRGIRRTDNRLNDYADRIEKPELLNISDVAKNRNWTLVRMGGLFYAPYRTKKYYRGQLTHYTDSKGQKRVAKEDEYGTPYGPASKGSDLAYWKPLVPATKRVVQRLSPAARAKQLANKRNPVTCLPPTDEELESFRLTLLGNGAPANDNRQPVGLPYDVKSKDELQFGYAFGKSYPDEPAEQYNDATERGQTLTELNARLSPQARLVANMIVQTDETEILAQNFADVGAAISGGRMKLSERTLMRRGQQAVNGTAKEIGTLLQELAA